MVNGKYKTNQGALEGLNETQELKTFYQRIMGIREETAVQELAEHSELLSLKAKTILLKENDKVERIHFLYKTGGIVKAYYDTRKGKKQIHCFAYLPGEPLVGIMNIDDDIYRLSRESIDVALACTRMQGISAIREYEYEKMILSYNPLQRYEYFVETYPEIVDKVSKKEIASYLNMTPESLSRVLKKYKELHG